MMTTDAQSSPFEELTVLLDEYGRQAAEWRERLPTLRARTAATGVMLDRLARTWPTDPPPRRGYADVVLAAPSKDWAEDVADRLRVILPAGTRVELGRGSESPRDAPLSSECTVNCEVWLAGVYGKKATAQVRTALATIEGLKVAYSESLDLVVVSPSG
jgi:hypothetical protein